MTDDNPTDADIERKILARWGEQFSGLPVTTHIVRIDGFQLGRPIDEWHDEIVDQIDEIRTTKRISAEKAAREIAKPYLKNHNVSFESFMAAYWKRRRERAAERFIQTIIDGDMPSAISAWKGLTKPQRKRFGVI